MIDISLQIKAAWMITLAVSAGAIDPALARALRVLHRLARLQTLYCLAN
ncbi:hypothetical protein HN018_22270 (plasmid) [Lichenicola cladoniae]|uniref:Uncharacterized protein n=1 Tax=Lichenicola cladoniae TaxID=1484109 RepID=A0A6M8HXL6_9PROT|nr:hypothetical protein [Lichenicola cladoniae]NPD70317.1 hypothetical protein [Acetobacteraceae bacterium]QKE92947.1 hypothetical protein HN018_22270 [Lichenicola cladoniae]